VKCRFIEAESAHHTVQTLCRTLDVPRSTYYAHCGQKQTESAKEDEILLIEIKAIHKSSKHRYGSRRVWKKLAKSRRGLGRRRVARLMRENGLRAKFPRKFRVTTNSSHTDAIAPNLLDREFTADAPNRKWAGDITYIWTRSGWIYLAVILDLFSRRVVGWAMSTKIDKKLVMTALNMAVGQRRPEPGLLHHTDRGSQYTADTYRKILKKFEAISSMSRKGDCWDNAVSESFFGTLKKESIFGEDFDSQEEARVAILQYLRWYNAERMHSSLGYLSPCEFEKEAAELMLSQAL
jgi:transposase InsO family protein